VLVELVHVNGGIETVHPGVVIGAGGAHSVTRVSMSESLAGLTYQGHFLVADIAMRAPFPRDESSVVCGPGGLLLLAPPRRALDQFQDPKSRSRLYPPKTSWHVSRYGSGEMPTCGRRLVRSFECTGDRLAPVGQPLFSNRGRRSPLEPVRR
jgi:hypothetical protein